MFAAKVKNIAGMILICATGFSCGPSTKKAEASDKAPTTQEKTTPSSPKKPAPITEPSSIPKPEASSDIDVIKAHQSKRFKDLETILDKNIKYHVKFPGQNAQKHALGTGIARDSWSNPNDFQQMIDHISSLIEALEKKYPGRVHFGLIGDYKFNPPSKDCIIGELNEQGAPGPQADGTFMIHVWGANEGNFNLENNQPGPFGSGQATCFINQRPGVFGISTLPGNKSTLMAPDRLLELY